MPSIRLADIPNAGPQSAGVSTNLLAPQVAQLGSAAAANPSALTAPARGMLTQTLELGAFSQEARAAAHFADAIGGLGDVANKWGQKFAEAKDAADISKAETILQSVWDKQQTDQLGQPVEKWSEIWNRNQEEAKRQLGDIKFSNNAAEKINPYFERWATLSTVKIDGQAKKQEINGFRSSMEANAYAKLANNDFEGAFAVMDESAKKGLHTPEEVTLWKSKLYDDQIRHAQKLQDEKITGEILADPYSAKDILTKAKNGEETEFGKMDATKIKLHLYQADRQIRANEVENWNTLVQKIQGGEITGKDQLAKEAEGMRLEPAKLKRLESALAANIPFDPHAAAELKARVAGYDPSTDKNDATFWELSQEIPSRLPKEHAQNLLEELKSSWKKGFDGGAKSPRDVWKGKFLENIVSLGNSGWLGETGLDKHGKKITDPAKNDAFWARIYATLQGMEEWFKNPANKDKTPQDAQAYRDSLIAPLLDEKARAEFKKSKPSLLPVEDFPSFNAGSANVKSATSSPIPTPPPSKDAVEKGKEIKAKSEGKVTSYNFPGDPYSDTNSRNGIGAWNNKLTENSLAISPDIERKFQAAGIGKGDPVELKLSDGSTVIRTWDDRTSDKLRGRFDFHSPKGRQAKDGMAVVSFRKAPTA